MTCIITYPLPISVPFAIIMMYTYYHGIIDHSGITFKHYWWQPWQPDCIFHDNHHQYFHVNFGFNIKFWDQVSSVSFPRLIRLEVFSPKNLANLVHGEYFFMIS